MQLHSSACKSVIRLTPSKVSRSVFVHRKTVFWSCKFGCPRGYWNLRWVSIVKCAVGVARIRSRGVFEARSTGERHRACILELRRLEPNEFGFARRGDHHPENNRERSWPLDRWRRRCVEGGSVGPSPCVVPGYGGPFDYGFPRLYLTRSTTTIGFVAGPDPCRCPDLRPPAAMQSWGPPGPPREPTQNKSGTNR